MVSRSPLSSTSWLSNLAVPSRVSCARTTSVPSNRDVFSAVSRVGLEQESNVSSATTHAQPRGLHCLSIFAGGSRSSAVFTSDLSSARPRLLQVNPARRLGRVEMGATSLEGCSWSAKNGRQTRASTRRLDRDSLMLGRSTMRVELDSGEAELLAPTGSERKRRPLAAPPWLEDRPRETGAQSSDGQAGAGHRTVIR